MMSQCTLGNMGHNYVLSNDYLLAMHSGSSACLISLSVQISTYEVHGVICTNRSL